MEALKLRDVAERVNALVALGYGDLYVYTVQRYDSLTYLSHVTDVEHDTGDDISHVVDSKHKDDVIVVW